jgi:integrase/recombinase XerC
VTNQDKLDKFLLKVKQISVNPLLKHKSLKTAKKVQIPFSEKEMKDVFFDNDYKDITRLCYRFLL